MNPLIQKDKDLLLAAETRVIELVNESAAKNKQLHDRVNDFLKVVSDYHFNRDWPFTGDHRVTGGDIANRWGNLLQSFRIYDASCINRSWAGGDFDKAKALIGRLLVEHFTDRPIFADPPPPTRWRNLADIDRWQRALTYCTGGDMPNSCAIFQKYIDEEMKYPVKPDWDEGAVNTVTADVKAFKENATLLHKQTNGHIPAPSGAPLTYEDIKAKYDTLCPPISSSTQGTTMSIKIEQKTFVTAPGLCTIETKDLKVDIAVNVIKQAEDEIERLEKLKNKPKSVTKKIEDLQAGIDALVKELDSREETK